MHFVFFYLIAIIHRLLLCPCTQNLGIEDGIRKFDIVGQKNHGVTAVGKDPWEAFEHIERVEHICQIVLASGVRPPEKEDGKRKKFNLFI